MTLTPEEQQILNIIGDEIKWAKVELGWKARWYQEKILRESTNRTVLRCGRRVGKCLPGWVRVLDPDTGDRVPVEDLYRRGQATVVTMTEDYKLKRTTTSIVHDNGVKEVFRVTLASGRIIDATGNHPLYTISGWKEIDNLRVGDYVATPRALPFFGNEEIPDHEVKILAYMIGDGNAKGGNLGFTSSNERVIQDMDDALRSIDCFLKKYESNRPYDYCVLCSRISPHPLRELLDRYGVLDLGVGEKYVPDIIFRLSKRQIALFLSRLFATDGWVSVSAKPPEGRKRPGFEIGYASVSETLVRDIQHLLLRFGIQSSIRRKNVKYKDEYRTSWQLSITSKTGVELFAKEIGIFGKEEDVNKVLETCAMFEGKEDAIPAEIMKEVEAERIRLGLQKADMLLPGVDNGRLHTYYAPERSALLHWGRVLDNKRFQDLATSDIYWDKIVSIESIGYHQTYDLTIPETHNFVADDIIVHNTDSACVRILYRAFTKPGRDLDESYVVLVLAPYESQIEAIFKRLRELINRSTLLKASVVGDKQNPQEIRLANGSRITGYTVGSRSGGGATNIRGQRADFIYLDRSVKSTVPRLSNQALQTR